MTSPQNLRVGDRLAERFVVTKCLEQTPSLCTFEASVESDESARVLVALVPLSSDEAISSIEQRSRAIRDLGGTRLLPMERTDDWNQHACFASTAVAGHPLSVVWTKDWVASNQFHDVFAHLGGSLRTAHQVELFHGWLNPQYVYVSETTPGVALITDLALAVIRREAVRDGNSIVTAQVGELAYVAPELLALAQPADARADVYSFGALLYRALTGRSPFQAANAIDFALHKKQVAPTALKSIRPDLPVVVSQTIERSLAPDPSSRPARIDEMLHALRVLAVADSPSRASTEELCRVWSPDELRAAVLAGRGAPKPAENSPSAGSNALVAGSSLGGDTPRKRTIALVCIALALFAAICAVLLHWCARIADRQAPPPQPSHEEQGQNSDWE